MPQEQSNMQCKESKCRVLQLVSHMRCKTAQKEIYKVRATCYQKLIVLLKEGPSLVVLDGKSLLIQAANTSVLHP